MILSKHINGFEDYLIFPTGKVYSLKRNKYLSLGITHKGYYQVGLYKSGNRYFKLVARLVAMAFIPNPNNKPQINHKDGNKLNNNVSNLEWLTCSENHLHAFANGLNKRSPKSGSPRVPVKVYNYATGQFLSIQPSLSSAARRYGLFQQNVSNVLHGRCYHTGGLTFKRV